MLKVCLMMAKELRVRPSRGRRRCGSRVVDESRGGRGDDAEPIVILHGQSSARDRAGYLGIGLEPLLSRVIGLRADNLLVEMLAHLRIARAERRNAVGGLQEL